MDYEKLFKNLKSNPPKGWRVIHYVAGKQRGIYFWPAHVSHLIEPAHVPANELLLHYSMLFEFHVIEDSGHARILARTRFHGVKPKDDLRWLSLRNTAVTHCRGKSVKEVSHAANTASVALWDDGSLRKITPQTPVSDAADLLRNFFSNPPTALTVFVAHL